MKTKMRWTLIGAAAAMAVVLALWGGQEPHDGLLHWRHHPEPTMENPTVVVLTGRNDLDDQLFGAFSRCQDLLRQPPT